MVKKNSTLDASDSTDNDTGDRPSAQSSIDPARPLALVDIDPIPAATIAIDTAFELVRSNASRLLPNTVDTARGTLSREFDKIIAHGQDRGGIYYLLQWCDTSLPPSKRYLHKIDTQDALHTCLATQANSVKRPRAFRHIHNAGTVQLNSRIPTVSRKRARRS
ncbi:hypothetical protein BC833DRAFT_568905 [Globomyces pollinis-pini]|nr:hypothetical protein BC833DRAFT_568905 [Globomyces pollinis-pini]